MNAQPLFVSTEIIESFMPEGGHAWENERSAWVEETSAFLAQDQADDVLDVRVRIDVLNRNAALFDAITFSFSLERSAQSALLAFNETLQVDDTEINNIVLSISPTETVLLFQHADDHNMPGIGIMALDHEGYAAGQFGFTTQSSDACSRTVIVTGNAHIQEGMLHYRMGEHAMLCLNIHERTAYIEN